MTWRDEAACLNYEPEWWFAYHTLSQGRGTRHTDESRLAISICEQCPVKEECLAFAMENKQQTINGIWGGTTSGERNTIRKHRSTA